MSKIAVIFKSKYGSTEKYAQWISEDLNADLMDASKVSAENLLEYDTIIFGGGLYAGGINGVKAITSNFDKIKDKNIAVFTVGLSSTEDLSVFKPIVDKNFTPEMQSKIKFFHLRGGMDYTKLSFLHKPMMAMMKKMVESKKVKTDDDKEMLKTYGGVVDFTDKKTIEPLVTYIKSVT